MATIIGIDQSYTSCGIVVIQDGTMVHHERVVTPIAMDVYDRANYLAHHINGVVGNYTNFDNDPTVWPVIGIEGLAFGMRGNATRDLAGLLFVIITTLRNCNGDLKIGIVSPLTVKKFATGKGKADKKQLYEKLPDDVKTILETNYKKTTGLYDLTDAYWIAKYTEAAQAK